MHPLTLRLPVEMLPQPDADIAERMQRQREVKKDARLKPGFNRGGIIMQRPIQIVFRNMPPSDAVETHIKEKVEKLESFYSHIIGCKTTVELAGKHQHQGNLFNVRVEITVPGSELVVNRDMHEDIYVSLRDAFDAAKRQLEDYGRRQRGETKSHEGVLHGHVARLFPDGFGFIETPDGQEFYFNRDNVAHPDFDKLEIGSEVQFIEEATGEGLQAKRISVGKHHYPG